MGCGLVVAAHAVYNAFPGDTVNMLGDVPPTQYDLHFTLFGIPVRVHPMFWLISALIVSSVNDLPLVLIGMGCVFVSILVHEMGHALVARRFGWPPRVVLYHFGGMAIYSPNYGHTPQRSILISFAGPAAGFLLYGIVVGIEAAVIDAQQRLSVGGFFAIQILKWINLIWGIINLLPVYPLDGGQISRTLLTWLKPAGGLKASLIISIGVGAAAAIWFLVDRRFFAAMLFGSLAVNSYQQWQAYRGRY